MRLEAMTRRPAFSKRSMMAPVWLRLVASGLMMESVRSTAISESSDREFARLIEAACRKGKNPGPHARILGRRGCFGAERGVFDGDTHAGIAADGGHRRIELLRQRLDEAGAKAALGRRRGAVFAANGIVGDG